MSEAEIKKLKRKRTTERAKATRFITTITTSRVTPTSTTMSTIEAGSRKRCIKDFLVDREYTSDVEVCEDYIDSANRAILKGNQEIGRRLASSAASLSVSELTSAPTTRPLVTHSVKLPPLRLESFAGDVKMWAKFWEQFFIHSPEPYPFHHI